MGSAAKPSYPRKSVSKSGEAGAIALVVRQLPDVAPLFDSIPRLGLTKPGPASLHLWFTPEILRAGSERLRLLGLRLRGGAPHQSVHFYAPDRATAEQLSAAFAANVHVLPLHDAATFKAAVANRTLKTPPSLTIDRFGPVVLLISALWGRVGSTTIFDSQTRFLLESGAVVVRVLVHHHPGPGEPAVKRREALTALTLSCAEPHLTILAERDDRPHARAKLHKRPDYQNRSAIRRFELELEGARPLNPALLAWAGAAARLTIVNHAIHMAFAQRISAAPIILETHDILARQIQSHGLPDFVGADNENQALREADQQDIWRRAAACVNLSPQDDAIIARHARASICLRPYAEAATPRPRPWPQVVRANALSAPFGDHESFDILLWGDWHAGNARAIIWFVQQVLAATPALGDARIALIGRVTRRLPEPIRAHPQLLVADFIDRIEDIFARTKILAIADQDGSGVSVKAIDAIRFGKPFVSTRHGLRGLDLAGIDCPQHETSRAFAQDLIALLSNPAALARRGATARAIHRRNCSYGTYVAAWRNIIAKVAPELSTAPQDR